jgi:hypothetical protein
MQTNNTFQDFLKRAASFLTFVILFLFTNNVQSQTYCASKGNEPWQEWLTQIVFSHDGSAWSSGKSQYSDFTNREFNLPNGGQYTLTLNATWSYVTYNEYVKVWIDLNKNGTFEEPSETMISTQFGLPVSGANVSSSTFGQFTIPANAPAGKTRMRISMKRGSAPTPCETFQYGEVEDYSVILSGPVTNSQYDFTLLTADSYFPTSLVRGLSFGSYINVKNNGPGNLLPSQVIGYDLFYSTNNVFDASDINLTSGVPGFGSNLTAGTSSVGNTNCFLPSNTPLGNGFLIAKVDAGNQFVETNEGNNTIVSPLNVVDTGRPNLVGAKTTYPQSAFAEVGGFVQLSYAYSNLGPAEVTTTANLKVGFYLSSDAVLGSSDTKIGVYEGEGTFIPILGSPTVGYFETFGIGVNIPAGTPFGNYFIIVKMDDDNAVIETNETDNNYAYPFLIGASGNCADNILSNPNFELPANSNWFGTTTVITTDLDASSGVLAAKLCVNDAFIQNNQMISGKNLTFRYTAKNTGANNGSFVNLKYLSASFQVLGQINDPITASTYTTKEHNITTPANTAWIEVGFRRGASGTGCLFVDDFCLTDNTPPPPVQPDLTFIELNPAPITGFFPNGEFQYSGSYANYGAGEVTTPWQIKYYLSTNATLENTDLSIGMVDGFIPTEANVGGGILATLNIPVGTAPGDYFLLAKIDANNTIVESDETNNLMVQPLQIADPAVYNCYAYATAPWQEWISKVKIGNKTSNSDKFFHLDQTTLFFNLVKNASNPIEIGATWSYVTNDEYVRIWIDYNRDNVYQSSEKAFEGILTKPANGVNATKSLLGNINVPANALLGGTYMRVLMRRSVYPNACGEYEFGEVENYQVTVEPGGVVTNAPDLILKNPIPSPVIIQNYGAGVVLTVENLTGVATQSPFMVNAYLSTDNVLSPNDQFVGGISYGNISLTSTILAEFSVGIGNNLASGAYFLIYKVDVNNSIIETNEQNNTLVVSCIIEAPSSTNCTASADNPYFTWISKVKVGLVEKTSSKNQYSDFTATTFSLSKTNPNPIAITNTWSYASLNEVVTQRVWIDFNHNNTFEGSELAFSGSLTMTEYGANLSKIISGNLTIPASALTGSAKMRVVHRLATFGEVCGIVDFGEVEDYTVNIVQNLTTGTGRSNTIDYSEIENYQFFPNPAGESVFVKIPVSESISKVSLLNQMGLVEKIQEFTSISRIGNDAEIVYEFTLNEVSNGVYFMKIETAGQRTLVRKLVVNRMY